MPIPLPKKQIFPASYTACSSPMNWHFKGFRHFWAIVLFEQRLRGLSGFGTDCRY
jgi:hypothetical protein